MNNHHNSFFIPSWQSVKRRVNNLKLGQPIKSESVKGPYVYAQKRKYVDFLMGWGSVITEHSDSDLIKYVTSELSNGIIYNNHSQIEFEVADLFKKMHKFPVRVGFAMNGSDVVTSAVRIARHTTRRKLVYFAGYHGWHDWAQPNTPGVINNFQSQKIDLSKNPDNALGEIEKNGLKIAAVVVEIPVRSENAHTTIRKIKELSRKHHFLIIFDEIKSGLRMGMTPGIGLYKVEPDLITYGKAFGGGFPISILVCKEEHLSDLAGIKMSATYWGHPTGLYAAKFLISKFDKLSLDSKINDQAKNFVNKFNRLFKKHDLNIQLDNFHTMPKLIFEEKECLIPKFYKSAFKNNLYLRIGISHCWFLSLCHNNTVQKEALQSFEKVAIELSKLK